MNKNETQLKIKKHNLIETLTYHLLPGILTGTGYYLLRQPLQQKGYPSMMALVIAGILILIPSQLAILSFQSKKLTGNRSIKNIISYKKPIVWWQVILFAILIVLVTGLIFTIMKPIDTFLQTNLFSWVPSIESGLNHSYSKSALIQTYVLMTLFLVILAPLVEELYFRGFLLPRTPSKLPALLHTFLFATYHIWTPWMIITRTIGILPLVYAVKKKNILVGILAHIIINSFDAIAAFAFIAKL